MEFLKELTYDMQDYDKQLSRKLIERDTMFIGRLTGEFKSDVVTA